MYEAVVTGAGSLYLACQIGGHCQGGQKVAITITAVEDAGDSGSGSGQGPGSGELGSGDAPGSGAVVAAGEAGHSAACPASCASWVISHTEQMLQAS